MLPGEFVPWTKKKKNQSTSVGFEPGYLKYWGKHITTRTTRPTSDKSSRFCIFFRDTSSDNESLIRCFLIKTMSIQIQINNFSCLRRYELADQMFSYKNHVFTNSDKLFYLFKAI